jgi:hypothetical protein
MSAVEPTTDQIVQDFLKEMLRRGLSTLVMRAIEPNKPKLQFKSNTGEAATWTIMSWLNKMEAKAQLGIAKAFHAQERCPICPIIAVGTEIRPSFDELPDAAKQDHADLAGIAITAVKEAIRSHVDADAPTAAERPSQLVKPT